MTGQLFTYSFGLMITKESDKLSINNSANFSVETLLHIVFIHSKNEVESLIILSSDLPCSMAFHEIINTMWFHAWLTAIIGGRACFMTRCCSTINVPLKYSMPWYLNKKLSFQKLFYRNRFSKIEIVSFQSIIQNKLECIGFLGKHSILFVYIIF